MTDEIKKDNMTLEECVCAFLELALMHPEKPPKSRRAQRDNEAIIIGYNRAQENLRSILEHHGKTPEVKKLAKTRSDGQTRPMDGPGGIKMWEMS